MHLRFTSLLEKSRLHYLAPLSILFFTINLATRIAFQLAFPGMLPFSAETAPGLGAGFLNDAATLPFVLLFPATLLLLPKESFMGKTTGKAYVISIFLLFSLIFIFTAFAEFFFWDEFSSRFNFIAVDYLIYTTELVRNIVESYPLPELLSAVFILAVAAALGMWKILRRIQKKMAELPTPAQNRAPWSTRLITLGGLYMTALMLFIFFSPLAPSRNRFWNEYAQNGVYEIFSAYLNNQLDYHSFYRTMDQGEAFSLLRGTIKGADKTFAAAPGNNFIRTADASPHPHTPNVIIVIMESMGIRQLGENTPNLNALASAGLSFTNMLSTGTRTVRGLEAIMLSIPPTPGNSIVRRPDNDQLFNLGTPFRKKGYDLSFIYGGIGFFDNMNAFFANNGYEAIDKLGFNRENKTFANAWGQCDEDLYAQSLTMADKSHAAGRLFQQVLLTTSNHRPFTYPEGKVALESGLSGRKGAIQYSDYAVGEFLRHAKSRPWFDNTIFIFVGDHPASVAGKTEVPADAYNIVCIMYGPQFFKPESTDTLCSQIDIAPTLFAVLGWGYASRFFGTDVRALPKNEGRAWISTYQLLGFRTNDRLVVLKPGGQAEVTPLPDLFSDSEEGHGSTETNEAALARAVATYQCAYDLFVNKQLKEGAILAYMPEPLTPEHAP
ncbi:MAG: LTA synthase family protein [Desulfovibrionaceae bacterium]|nr:LTA synthase family protein [Desulfovibrionaceae bacterium]